MRRGLKAPLSGQEINELIGLFRSKPQAAKIAPQIFQRLLTLDLIADSRNGVDLTETGRERAEAELRIARGQPNQS